MNFVCVLFTALTLFQYVTIDAEFSPIEWKVSPSEQCGEYTNPDFTRVLATLTQMINDDESAAVLPKSCMEIKENSPASPSGYYTISNGTSGNAAVVYCNMDDLYSCPALEQTLSGIMKDINSLSVDVNSPLFASCSEVKERCPHCESGIYEIVVDPNNVKFIYCALKDSTNATFCDITGHWTKLASWEISTMGPSCPSGLQLFVEDQVYACGIPEGGVSPAGCLSLHLLSSTDPYTMVCGKMVGYQKGSDDAFNNFPSPTINEPYVDGVSITRGTPRRHIWTYAMGNAEDNNVACPCSIGNSFPPAFVGADYFCESGCLTGCDVTTFYAGDPLWDGQQCSSTEAACCDLPGQPWFHKVLEAPTTNYIEMRLCINELTKTENVLISSYEIYVL